jgi:hypothetical protein
MVAESLLEEREQRRGRYRLFKVNFSCPLSKAGNMAGEVGRGGQLLQQCCLHCCEVSSSHQTVDKQDMC